MVVRLDILKALRIFDISDINELDDIVLKKRFREIMRKGHPDLGGDEEKAKEVNIAYGIIKKALRELKAYKEVTKKEEEIMCIIPLNKLVDVYLGEELKITGSDKVVTLSRGKLSKFKIILNIKVDIVYKGNTYTFEDTCVSNIKDEYSVTCKIVDSDVSSTEGITIKSCGKVVSVNMRGRRLNVLLSLDKLVKLTICVERVERNG